MVFIGEADDNYSYIENSLKKTVSGIEKAFVDYSWDLERARAHKELTLLLLVPQS